MPPQTRRSPSIAHGQTEDWLYRQVRDEVISGRIPPNKRLTETSIAAMHGVSRTPVRTVFSRLRREGYLVAEEATAARTQLSVAPLSRNDIEELWRIIGALEGLAVEFIEAMAPADRESVARRMEAINDRLLRASRAESRDPDLLQRLQSDFHWTMMGAIATPRLAMLYSQVRPQAERYEFVYGSLPQVDFTASIAEHASIVELIRAGAGSDARTAIETHWARASERTGNLISRLL